MKLIKSVAGALMIAGATFIASVQAQQNSPLKRTDLVKNEISTPGLQAVQARVDFAPGAVSIKHSHPGEEVACPEGLNRVSARRQRACDAENR